MGSRPILSSNRLGKQIATEEHLTSEWFIRNGSLILPIAHSGITMFACYSFHIFTSCYSAALLFCPRTAFFGLISSNQSLHWKHAYTSNCMKSFASRIDVFGSPGSSKGDWASSVAVAGTSAFEHSLDKGEPYSPPAAASVICENVRVT